MMPRCVSEYGPRGLVLQVILGSPNGVGSPLDPLAKDRLPSSGHILAWGGQGGLTLHLINALGTAPVALSQGVGGTL